MVLSFGQVKDEDVSTLIGRKNFAKAIEVIKSQLKNQRPDPRLRLQLGDVLVMAGKNKEAVAILSPLADEFAREGFAAKAISVFKKIQRIDPGARDVDAKLASLIQAKQQQATVPMPAPAHAGLELGMEEIGFEAFGAVSVPVPAAPQPPAPQPPAPQAPAPVEDRDLFAGGMEGTEPEAELGFDVDPPLIERAPTPDAGRDAFAAKARPERQVASTPASTEVELGFLDANTEPGFPGFPAEAVFTLEPEPVLELVPEIVDDVANEVVLSAEVMEAIPEEVPLEEMSESLFADELLSLVEGAFKDVALPDAPAGRPGDGGSGAGNQIVVSPLFKDFSVDELVAVIQGLNLLTYQAGEIIIMEGDAGQSLYMLTAGTVRALRRNAAGKQATIGELAEGAFFGEMSILTGKPRTATVVAATYCELLELDRPTLDGIVTRHPHVLEVLKVFAAERQKH